MFSRLYYPLALGIEKGSRGIDGEGDNYHIGSFI